MKLYGYHNDNGIIEACEVEVEEELVLVPTKGECFPFYYGGYLEKENIGELVGFSEETLFLKSPDPKFALDMFRQRAKEKYLESEKEYLYYRELLEKLEAENERS